MLLKNEGKKRKIRVDARLVHKRGFRCELSVLPPATLRAGVVSQQPLGESGVMEAREGETPISKPFEAPDSKQERDSR